MPDEMPKVVKDQPEGLKYDEEKPPLALIPPEAEEEEARVWAYGRRKYGTHNFRRGISILRILSALRRHTSAITRGEDRDLETGCLHAAHIRCCAAMLIVFQGRTDLDDRHTALDKQPKST
jgi:hypothetical protein